MKSKTTWKPLGHSAKRWHGPTPRKDNATPPHVFRPNKKKDSGNEPVWK